jgi:hypothetical protein
VSAPQRRHWARIAIPAAGAGLIVLSLATASATHAAGNPVSFTDPIVVDPVRHGGEPGVIASKYGTLVYSSHEGTTHLDRTGLAGQSTQQFLCPDPSTASCYQNHVWIWTSEDQGKTWQLRNENLSYTGFSDPDLTTDAAGTIYDTGIDLANDALFSSPDGGKTWPTGTAQCHEGDRPWLAGGVAGEVFLTTDSATGGHILTHSSNYGASCDSATIADSGTTADGLNFSGFGKGVYDRFDGSFIEPAQFTKTTTDSNGVTTSTKIVGFGISRLPHAADAFNGGGETFQAQLVAPTTDGVYSPFGVPEVISMDSAENIYFAWDSDNRDPNGTAGCSGALPNVSGGLTGGPTPLPNHIMLSAGKHVGSGAWSFQAPISLAHQGNARVLWPWSVAGSPGNLSVVWYQMDKMVDPDCDGYDGTTISDVKTYVYEAHISNALDPAARKVTVTNVAPAHAIHEGGICDSGTTCVATGQDRRLGDYFTNAVDANGCVLIATGDTTTPDAISQGTRATSLPVFFRQTSGPSLTGGDCGPTVAAAATTASPTATPAATASANAIALPNTATGSGGPSLPGAAVAVGATTLLLTLRRRRRRRRR